MRDSNQVPRVLRHLVAAEGYLELGMPEHAFDELDNITESEAGPLLSAVAFYKGESLLAQKKYDDAIAPLKYAAETIPAPMNKQAWLSLGECFRQRGEEALAVVVEMFAEEPPLELPEGNWDVSIEVYETQTDGEEIKYEYLASSSADFDSYSDEEFGEGIIEETEADDYTIEPDDEDYGYDHDQFNN